jgi:hypothetical protein
LTAGLGELSRACFWFAGLPTYMDALPRDLPQHPDHE